MLEDRSGTRTRNFTLHGEDLPLFGKLTGTYTQNPIAFMARAALFVLSSTWEGLSNALVEALGVGCPVVSTDCEAGPREVLEDGTWGRLVPVGDVEALANAMEATLDDPPDRTWLKGGARRFELDPIADRYLEVLLPAPGDLTGPGASPPNQ